MPDDFDSSHGMGAVSTTTTSRDNIRGFAEYLLKANIHPVLIFGTGAAGKTMFLLSLMAYTKRVAELGIEVSLGERPYPSDFLDANNRWENAVEFYEDRIAQFMDKKVPNRTQITLPFFIPIKLTVTKDGRSEVFHMAFLEGMGEWYEKGVKIDDGALDAPYRFKDFPAEVDGLLSNYTNPISIIFVAPGEGEDRSDAKRDYSHRCLANCMERYTKVRTDVIRDNLLLLITKWDAVYKPTDRNGHFANANADDVVSKLREWPEIWPKFSSIAGVQKNGKALLPYAAAWVNEKNEMIQPGQAYQDAFHKFNRTVWNWLYSNLRQATGNEHEGVRPVLYPDVVPPDPKKVSRVTVFTRKLLWV